MKLFLFVIGIFLITSCDDATETETDTVTIEITTTETEVESQTIDDRIKSHGSTIIDGYEYSIIEVDSVEYLVNGDGGICPLVNKQPITLCQ